MSRPLNRIEPQAGPAFFQTYQVAAPITSHRRRATCAEVDCPKRRHGYRAVFDVSTIEGRKNAHMVESLKARRMFGRTVQGPMVTYTFPAGQDCLDVHSVPLAREPFYVVRDGDHRGNPRQTPARRLNEADWLDHFANHQMSIAERIQRG